MTTPSKFSKTVNYKGKPYYKSQVNDMESLFKLKLPNPKNNSKLKLSKKINRKANVNVNSNDIIGYGPGLKKPAHSALADALFANNNNFVMVPTNPQIDSNANHIMSYSMNSGVGLGKNWTVLFAHDVVIPVGNPMAPVLTLSTDITKSTAHAPVSRTQSNVFENPSLFGHLNIQEFIKQKAEQLMATNNKNLADLFMDRP